MEYFFEAKGITKEFGGLTAVNKVTFHINRGEIFGLIGPNGAGKTTLFNLVAGVYKPDGGSIEFNGKAIFNLRPDQICRKGIARTFQITKPFLDMTILENVIVGAYFGSSQKKNLKEAQGKAEEAIGRAGLAKKVGTLAKDLILIERKRLELARALATQPTLLLLDEVFGGLNPTEILEMIKTVLGIRDSGVTIFMIEHVIKAVTKMSDRVMVLDYGKKIAEGFPQDIVKHPDVIQAYLGGTTTNA
ncbi:MAG: ABC transporter ATP-binding protein [Thermodesulfobacteriota bacterium]|jgi:branched-chain amino acid transport system ATP-binding protein